MFFCHCVFNLSSVSETISPIFWCLFCQLRRKMSNSEQQLETEDMYDDELDCVYKEEENGAEEEDDEKGNEGMEVKEEELEADNEIADYRAVIESQSTEPKTKTEEQDETSIDMYNDKFHLNMEKDFAATSENVNEVDEELRENEESETDSDATEIDDEDYEAVSESQTTDAVVSGSLNSASGEQQTNRRQKKAKSHKCQQCNKSFDRPSHLKRHQLVHTDARPYKCTTCSKSFKSKNELKRHQLLHTNPRAHKCATCSKPFTLLHNLKTHQKVHSNSRPFQCTICQQTFKHKYSLKSHLQVKHPQ